MRRIWIKILCWWYKEPNIWAENRTDTYWCPNCEVRLEYGNGWKRIFIDRGGESRYYEIGGCPYCGAKVNGPTKLDALRSLYNYMNY